MPGEIDGRRFLSAMARFGWIVETQRGSHRKLAHEGRADFLIVAFHGKIGRNSIRRALRQARIAEDEFLKEL